MVSRAIRQWCLVGLIGLVVVFSACSGSNNQNKTSGKGSIRAIDALPELGSVTFLIEETNLSSLSYKEASGTSNYDDLNYDFNFDTLFPGDSDATRLATKNLSVKADTEYTFILRGALADPEILLWEQPGRDWAQELKDASDNDTEVIVMEVSFGNVNANIGPVDIYFESPGTSPQFATPLGTIDNGDLLPATELTQGDYQLVITPQGDPTTILFASDAISLSAATSNLFTIMDSASRTTGDFVVRRVGTGTDLPNLFAETKLDVLHAAFGTEPVDIVVNGDFSNPLVSNLAYSEFADDLTIDDEAITITVTPAGNPGVFLAQKQIDLTAGTFNQLYLVGLPGQMSAVLLSDSKYTLATYARIQLFQAAARFQSMDVYFVSDDVDITLTGANLSGFSFGTGSGNLTREEGSYNLFLTRSGTKNVIGGPFHMDLAAGRNYSIVVVDASNITAADILTFDRTPE
jgi:Domain of unknown function (DUF4397)